MASKNLAIEAAFEDILTNLQVLRGFVNFDEVGKISSPIPAYSSVDTLKNYIFFLEKRVEKLGGALVVEEHEDLEEFTRPIEEELTVCEPQKKSIWNKIVHFVKKFFWMIRQTH